MLTKLEFTPPVSVKAPSTKLYNNPSSRSPDVSRRRTDRWTDMAGLMVAFHNIAKEPQKNIECVSLATEPDISLIILPLMRILLAGGPLLRVATIRRTTDTFLFISHTTNVLLFKFVAISSLVLELLKKCRVR